MTVQNAVENRHQTVWEALAGIMNKKPGDGTTSEEISNILMMNRKSLSKTIFLLLLTRQLRGKKKP